MQSNTQIESVLETEETAREEVVAVGVLAIDPPSKVDNELLEDALEEARVPAELVHAIARPCMHRWVHVVEGKLVSRQATRRG